MERLASADRGKKEARPMGQGWGGRHAARGGAAAARPLQAVAVGAGVRPRPAPPLAGRGRPLLTERFMASDIWPSFPIPWGDSMGGAYQTIHGERVGRAPRVWGGAANRPTPQAAVLGVGSFHARHRRLGARAGRFLPIYHNRYYLARRNWGLCCACGCPRFLRDK